MIVITDMVIATGVAIAMITPQASTCFHDNVLVGRASVGSGFESGQKGGREGATLAG